MSNVFNMPLSVLHVADNLIDAHTAETIVWGVVAETGEILAKESIERFLFGNAEHVGAIRDMVVALRMRGYKTLNEGGEYIE